MKAFLFSFIFSLSLVAFSEAAHAQAVVGGGGGGLGQMMLRAFFPIKNSSCEEGEMRNFFERDYTQDQSINVLRVCKNGSFYEKKNIDYKNLRCTEGTIGVQDARERGGYMIRRTFRCVDGERVLIRAENLNK